MIKRFKPWAELQAVHGGNDTLMFVNGCLLTRRMHEHGEVKVIRCKHSYARFKKIKYYISRVAVSNAPLTVTEEMFE